MEERIKLLEGEYRKLEESCDFCRGKMCGICPNNANKKRIKKEIKELKSHMNK